MKKQSAITDGVKTQTKSLDTKTTEYSQGSIKHFEIVNSSEQSGLYRVTAKVEVRVEDFKAFIAKLARDETKLDEGVFAQVATRLKNADNALTYVAESVIAPILEGRASIIKIGKPAVYSEWSKTHDKISIGWVARRASSKTRSCYRCM